MLFVLLFAILFAVACYAVGSSKGYDGNTCAVAGFFGGIVALIVLFILPDKAQEEADAARREASRDAEISALKRRISELEAQHLKEESASPAEASFPQEVSEGAPCIFPVRTEELIACPCCGKRQKGNRNACYSCGTPFQYEHE